MQSDPNPYASPRSEKLSDISNAILHLKAPSFALLLLSATWGGLGIVGVVAIAGAAVWTRATNLQQHEWFMRNGVWTDDTARILLMLVSCYIAYGAHCMRRGVGYWDAVAASSIACLPLLSPWVFLGMPFGVWSLLILLRSDVRAAFHAKAPLQLSQTAGSDGQS